MMKWAKGLSGAIGTLGWVVVGLLVFCALYLWASAWDRKNCFEDAARLCGADRAYRVLYEGSFFGGLCARTCSEEPGEPTVIDRSWPFGDDR